MAESSTMVGGNASAGGDFSGRDSYRASAGDNASNWAVGAGNRVEVHTSPLRADEYTDTELLRNLHRAIIGNPYNTHEPGLVKSVEALADSMSSLKAWKATVDFERESAAKQLQEYRVNVNQWQETINSRLASFMVVVWVTLSVVGIEAVALIWLFIQRS